MNPAMDAEYKAIIDDAKSITESIVWHDALDDPTASVCSANEIFADHDGTLHPDLPHPSGM